MHMPQFTAGASLYKTSLHYRLAAFWGGEAGEHIVLPQQGTGCVCAEDTTDPSSICRSGFRRFCCRPGRRPGEEDCDFVGCTTDPVTGEEKCSKTIGCCTPLPPLPPPGCIDQLGNEGCYPSFDGTNIKICKCGSGGNCGPCFHI